MSALISTVSHYGAALLTDGATCRGRVLIEDRRKVLVGGTVAVTMRGRQDTGLAIAERFREFAEQVGPAAAIDGVGDFAATMRAEFGVLAGEYTTEFMVVTFVPGRGGQHRYFQTEPITAQSSGETLQAYEVTGPGSLIMRPFPGKPQEIRDSGLLPTSGERLDVWARRGGLGIMQRMRERPGTAAGRAGFVSGIGGHVDLTLITAEGLTVERVHDWNDPIGEQIDIKRNPARPVAANGNRSQRRAARVG